jgi:hypothetical protein
LFGDEKLKEVLEKKYSLNIYFSELENDSKDILKSHF